MASTSVRSFSRVDYTVACICLMGIELAPVRAILDHIHPDLPTTRDRNSYVLGSIEQHIVVVAVIPEIGNNSAATVATQLVNDFPSVRFALLVGIGVCVPGEDGDNEIRLGDLVVSQPTGTFGGLVQYDFGKPLSNTGFEGKDQLNRPPAVLSANVCKLQAQHLMAGNRISHYPWEMVQRYPYTEATQSYPTTSPDRLFLASYTHQSEKSCKECDANRTVQRLERVSLQPQIHYGTIGSAKVVVKNAELRDKLQEDMGILCVEMEPAELMNSFPRLVVRGICDYADSHKNKKWQHYATAVAAAYMKELLVNIPSEQISDYQTSKGVMIADKQTHELLDQANKLHQKSFALQAQQSGMWYQRYLYDFKQPCHQAFRTSSYEQFRALVVLLE